MLSAETACFLAVLADKGVGIALAAELPMALHLLILGASADERIAHLALSDSDTKSSN